MLQGRRDSKSLTGDKIFNYSLRRLKIVIERKLISDIAFRNEQIISRQPLRIRESAYLRKTWASYSSALLRLTALPPGITAEPALGWP
jgi:hypothetical protein